MTVPPFKGGLDDRDIQGNVLHGYGSALPRACYVPVPIRDAVAGRRLLSALAERVTRAQHWGDEPPSRALNVAISAVGLKRLGVPEALLRRFPPEFAEGMPARARRLGDIGASAPRNWEPPLRTIQLLVVLHAAGDAALEREHAALRADADAAGVKLGDRQDAALLDGQREHFGYADGLAQPAIDLAPSDNDPGQGVPRPFRAQRSLALGEFVHGYRDEDGVLPAAPPSPFDRNGTFMVFRKLQQDVPRFRRLRHELAVEDFNGDEELTAAKLAGRWPDGTPLVVRPSSSANAKRPRNADLNDFDYRADPHGYTCPIGSHIRRANPRDSLNGGAVRTRRHRIIRRGMPYGPALPPNEVDDAERGLLFVCFNASIARQFEVVNGWLRDGAPFSLGRDGDVITRNGSGDSGKITFQGSVPVLSRVEGPLVWTRGGEYLFLPSVSALRALAAGDFRET
jgi:Dyp-type peroxidase family